MTVKELIKELEQYDADIKINPNLTVKELLDKLNLNDDIAYFMAMASD